MTSQTHFFDEIVSNATERINPKDCNALTYVGLEHLRSDSFHLLETGVSEDVEGQKFKMKEGDVLFGRRRAYQRKVGIAPSDGIFSAHGMILRPIPDVIDKDFLPFFIRSNAFMKEAIRQSEGSLSPTLNWSTIEDSEFNLPALSEQPKLSDMLWKLENLSDEYRKRLELYDELVKSRFIEMFGNPLNQSSDYPYAPISSFAKCVAGATPSTAIPDYWEGGNIPWLSSGEVNKGRIYSTEKTITQKGYDNCSTHLVPAHTVLIALAGQGKTRGTVAVTEIELCTNQSICSILTDETIDVDYLFQALKIQYDRIRTMSNGDGGRGGLNLEIVGKITVPKPPIELQRQFAKFVEQVDKSKFELQNQIQRCRQLQNSILDRCISCNSGL